jgi:hypothetical protein
LVLAYAKTVRSSWASVLVVGLLGCGDDPKETSSPEETLTFEVLHVGVDSVKTLRGRERLDALPGELARTPVDVLCLQGIGARSDRSRILHALAKVFPVSLDLATDDQTKVEDRAGIDGVVPPPKAKPPCKGFENALDSSLICMSGSFCLDEPGGSVVDARCIDRDFGCLGDSAYAADPERRCLSCIVGHANTGARVSEIRVRCTERDDPLVLGGDHGMVIVSKHPLSRPTLHLLPAEGTRRAIVGATVTTPAGREVDVVCASLGPTLLSGLPSDPDVSQPYAGPYGAPTDGWARENELQIEKLITHVDARRGGRPAVVLGNFGGSEQLTRPGGVTLPAAGTVGARRLEEAFVFAAPSGFAPSCTICPDNPLVAMNAAPSFFNRIYLAGMPRTAVRASARSYLGAVVSSDPERDFAAPRVPISVQFGFRSTIAIGP